MKGNISLKDFIQQVRKELVDAQDTTGDPFYELENVELEVSFALDIKGGAKWNLVVVELGTEANAAQLHKVTLSLKPLKKEVPSEPSDESKGGGGGGEIPGRRGPVYDKIRDQI